jgi:cyclophilin family peptidyl-prolyl cis-trans isomerase
MLRISDRVRLALAAMALASLSTGSTLWAAEPAKEKTGAAPSGKTPADDFAAKLEQWKSVLTRLRSLKSDWLTADEAKKAEIDKQWKAELENGEKLIAELRTVGIKAFAAAPRQDRDLERFLVKLLADDVARDAYEEADSLARALLENGCDDDRVFDDGGAAAFATNDFERAERYLKKAEEEGALTEKTREYLASVADYKKYWEEEKKIREKESQQNDLPQVRITTNKGEILVELFENEAPDTVGNFVSLVEKKFYDGKTFHRVLPKFMAQGGCPNGDGTGGPGYTIYCECQKDNYRKHFRGTLSMAHAGKDTGGSQFFLTFVPTPHLNGKHTGFGRVIGGMDVLAKIQRMDPESKEAKPQPDTIVKMEVVRKRPHEYKPNKSSS